MDEAERLARQRRLGYGETPFYRGEASGKTPDAYGGGAHFSRDEQYAKGFASKGGTDVREFRLNLENTFNDRAPITANRYAQLVEAAARQNPKLAVELAETIAPGKGVDWVIGFGKAQPEFVVVDRGGAPFIRHAIEKGSSDPIALFRAAGYDALDSGRDVRKLTGEGIRLKEARFNPSRAKSMNIMANWLPPMIVGGLAYDAATSEAKAAGLTPGESRTRGAIVGGLAGGATAGAQYGFSKAAPHMAKSALGRALMGAVPVASGAMGAFERGQQEAQPGSWFISGSGYAWPNIPLNSMSKASPPDEFDKAMSEFIDMAATMRE